MVKKQQIEHGVNDRARRFAKGILQKLKLADAAVVETGDFVADTSLIAEHLGWKPRIQFESGIDDVIADKDKKSIRRGL